MTPVDPAKPSPATHSQTLDRGLRALQVLSAAPDGLTISELAKELETHRAAIYRLLGPLGDHHLVARRDDGRFTLAAGLIQLAAAVRPRLTEAALPVLQRLSDRWSVTTALTVREGDEGVVAAVMLPREPNLHITYRVGMRHSLDQGAPGHVLLAADRPRDGESAAIERARDQGYAVSRGELLPGAVGVAAAVSTRGGDSAAISAVWIEGIDPDDIAAEVVAAARQIEANM